MGFCSSFACNERLLSFFTCNGGFWPSPEGRVVRLPSMGCGIIPFARRIPVSRWLKSEAGGEGHG